MFLRKFNISPINLFHSILSMYHNWACMSDDNKLILSSVLKQCWGKLSAEHFMELAAYLWILHNRFNYCCRSLIYHSLFHRTRRCCSSCWELINTISLILKLNPGFTYSLGVLRIPTAIWTLLMVIVRELLTITYRQFFFSTHGIGERDTE